MPGADGWALCRDLAADPRLAQTPVVIVSGVGPGDEAPAGRVVAYLRKPVVMADLLEVIRRF